VHGKGSKLEWKFPTFPAQRCDVLCISLYMSTDAVRLLDTLWNSQPAETDEDVGDMIAKSQTTVSAMPSHSAPTEEDSVYRLDEQLALHYRIAQSRMH